MSARTSSLLALSCMILSASFGLGCAATPGEPDTVTDEADGPEPDESLAQESDAVSGGTVAQAADNSCTTASVKGLSLQIIAEGNCLSPGAYAKVPSRSNLTVGSAVFPYLEKPARDQLLGSLDAHKSWHMTVNSMLRTIAQQYLLYRWYQQGRCGIGLAAKPGNSNHETGLAMDINPASTWKGSLENHGFHWLGSSDPVHFDYVGSGAVSHKGLDVKAFQRLWNHAHPGDKIDVDGQWGPQTEARMKKAPAAGFSAGPTCGESAMVDLVDREDEGG
ncbi:MAG: M15 family metallopeptidase [Byssovorax sp.]